MGSDMGHSMYYTDNEPPVDIIGKKRHFFDKPNSKALSNNQSGLRNDPSGAVNDKDAGARFDSNALGKIASAGILNALEN
jgi:hypothetical protein